MRKSKKWIMLLWLSTFLLLFMAGCSSSETTNIDHETMTPLTEQSSSNGEPIQNEEDTSSANVGSALDRNTEQQSTTKAATEEEQPSSSAGQHPQVTGPNGNQEEPASAQSKKAEQAGSADTIANNEANSSNKANNPASPVQQSVNQAESKEAPVAQTPEAIPPAPKMPIVTLAVFGPQEEGSVILATTEVELQDGDTVLDVLKRVTRANKIQMEYRGRNATAYVEGIDNLYEFDRGALSGWLYRVNGVFPDRSAGIWSVAEGDSIEWLYTVDLGKDVGGYVEGIQGQ